jgi:hypothetical protein
VAVKSTHAGLERLTTVARRGLYANIAAKRRRIKAGSGEKMRKVGAKGAPTSGQFKKAAQTARKNNKSRKSSKKRA